LAVPHANDRLAILSVTVGRSESLTSTPLCIQLEHPLRLT